MLAATSLGLGLWSIGLDTVLHGYADTMPDGSGYHLALWHGAGLPVLLSATVLLVGFGVFAARGRWASPGCADFRWARLTKCTTTSSGCSMWSRSG